jgi:threonine dehydrogenase-like Zn-dependent dehydrogenase
MTRTDHSCGPIGLLLVELLRLREAMTTIATDRLPHRVSAAAAMGFTGPLPVDMYSGVDVIAAGMAGSCPGGSGEPARW